MYKLKSIIRITNVKVSMNTCWVFFLSFFERFVHDKDVAFCYNFSFFNLTVISPLPPLSLSFYFFFFFFHLWQQFSGICII